MKQVCFGTEPRDQLGLWVWKSLCMVQQYSKLSETVISKKENTGEYWISISFHFINEYVSIYNDI